MNPLGANTILTFGRYKGFKLIFVPSIYLFWLADRIKNETMKSAVLEIATFNRLKELRITHSYVSVHEFATEMSEGFVSKIKIKRVPFKGNRRIPND
jgi:hypothetical protein